MLAAVYLDDDHLFRTNKIHNKRPHRVLAAEFKTSEASVTQMIPKQPLAIGHLLSQGPGALPVFYLSPLTLTLSPQAGRGDFDHLIRKYWSTKGAKGANSIDPFAFTCFRITSPNLSPEVQKYTNVS